MNGRLKAMQHIEKVRNYLNMVAKDFLDRGEKHDQSKLIPPEDKYLDYHSQNVDKVKYGTKQYYDFINTMKDGATAHYKHNSHHPEHYKNGINGMNLFDLLEMVCDWKVASSTYANGNIKRSLEINRKRHNIDKQLFNILCNTVKYIERKEICSQS